MNRRATNTAFAMLAALVSTVFIAGCKDSGPSARSFVKNSTNAPVRIAVIPFDNVTRDENAGKVVTNTVLVYLLSTGYFDVVEPGVLDEAMATASPPIRETSGSLKPKDLRYLADKLGVDAIIVGAVEDFGEVRINNDSYPSVSFSARMVNARTGEILWADTVSKAGADKEKLFGIGRVSSLGKLCKLAVAEMAASMQKHGETILAHLRSTVAAAPAGQQTSGPPQQTADHGTELPSAATPTAPEKPESAAVAQKPSGQAVEPSVSGAANGKVGGKAADETKEYAEADLKALLIDVAGFKKSEPAYEKHFHASVEARYTIGEGPQFVEVRLTDYRRAATAAKFMEHYHPGTSPAVFGGLPAYVYTSGFGYQHTNLAVGRFGLFIKGPEAKKESIEALAKALIAALQ